jgi:hypothetical protein
MLLPACKALKGGEVHWSLTLKERNAEGELGDLAN